MSNHSGDALYIAAMVLIFSAIVWITYDKYEMLMRACEETGNSRMACRDILLD